MAYLSAYQLGSLKGTPGLARIDLIRARVWGCGGVHRHILHLTCHTPQPTTYTLHPTSSILHGPGYATGTPQSRALKLAQGASSIVSPPLCSARPSSLACSSPWGHGCSTHCHGSPVHHTSSCASHLMIMCCASSLVIMGYEVACIIPHYHALWRDMHHVSLTSPYTFVTLNTWEHHV